MLDLVFDFGMYFGWMFVYDVELGVGVGVFYCGLVV